MTRLGATHPTLDEVAHAARPLSAPNAALHGAPPRVHRVSRLVAPPRSPRPALAPELPLALLDELLTQRTAAPAVIDPALVAIRRPLA